MLYWWRTTECRIVQSMFQLWGCAMPLPATWPLEKLWRRDTYHEHQNWNVPSKLSGSSDRWSSSCIQCFFQHSPPSLFLATFSSCVHHHLLFLASFPSTLCLTSPGKVTTELTEHLDMKDCDQHLNGALRWLVAPFGDASFYHEAFLKQLVFDLF